MHSSRVIPFDHALLAVMEASADSFVTNKRTYIFKRLHTSPGYIWESAIELSRNLSRTLCCLSADRMMIPIPWKTTCSRRWDTVYHLRTAATWISFSCNRGTLIQLSTSQLGLSSHSAFVISIKDNSHRPPCETVESVCCIQIQEQARNYVYISEHKSNRLTCLVENINITATISIMWENDCMEVMHPAHRLYK